MALDDQVRKNADALAKELGLDIQQAFGRFLDDVLAQVTKDQSVGVLSDLVVKSHAK